jgi:predicted CxxxxCH...CXXCH cytochrome family protein
VRVLKALLISTAVLTFVLVSSAEASTNVVPNPGLEQTGCGDSTPDICGWAVDAARGSFMYQDTSNPHSGNASMVLGWSGETGGEFGGWGSDATTDGAFCAAIGPGTHPASFWYRDAWSSDTPTWVSLGATFYQGPDCTGTTTDDSLGAFSQAPPGVWQQVRGSLTAPAETRSALLILTVAGSCDNYSGCEVSANFDDLEVDDAVLTTPAINSLSPTDGLVGTNVDLHGANFTGASSVTFNGTAASFSVDSDTEIHATVPVGASTGAISVTTPNGTATSSSSFTVDVPELDSFAPASAPIGGSVHLVGANFAGATGVKFNGTPATFTVYSNWEIYTSVPTGATTGPISVTTPTGTGTSSSSFTVVTDATPPDTTITSGPPATTTSSSATFQFTATEPSTFQCSVDTAAFAACSSPVTYTGLVAGSHTFRVRATDTAGNTDATPAQQTWTVLPNMSPTARFTFSCSGLTCHFDGTGSSDADGSITSYAWDFGDGTSAGGSNADHTYAHAVGQVVTLTVTDNGGATANQTRTVTPIALAAHGYRAKAIERVDLSWNGPTGVGFDVYRNGARIAAVQANSYTDNLNKKGSGTYTYKVCAAATPACSNQVTVSFTATGATTRAARPALSERARRGRGHHQPLWITHRGKKR